MKTLVQKINHKKEFSLINGISNQVKEIVILDPTIPDSHHIASGIKPGTATYILERQPDAVEQITTILAQHTDIWPSTSSHTAGTAAFTYAQQN